MALFIVLRIKRGVIVKYTKIKASHYTVTKDNVTFTIQKSDIYWTLYMINNITGYTDSLNFLKSMKECKDTVKEYIANKYNARHIAKLFTKI